MPCPLVEPGSVRRAGAGVSAAPRRRAAALRSFSSFRHAPRELYASGRV